MARTPEEIARDLNTNGVFTPKEWEAVIRFLQILAAERTAPEPVRKKSGYKFDGHIVARFNTLAGKERIVVDNGDGLLHIFNPDQMEPRTATGGEEPADASAPIGWAVHLDTGWKTYGDEGNAQRMAEFIGKLHWPLYLAPPNPPALPAPDKAQEELAREIALDYFEPEDRWFGTLQRDVLAALSAAHASGREEGERAMREAAAQLHEPSCSCPEPCDDYWHWPSPCHKKAAAVVRALPVPSPAQERGK